MSDVEAIKTHLKNLTNEEIKSLLIKAGIYDEICKPISHCKKDR